MSAVITSKSFTHREQKDTFTIQFANGPLGWGQTPHFTWAESNGNEGE